MSFLNQLRAQHAATSPLALWYQLYWLEGQAHLNLWLMDVKLPFNALRAQPYGLKRAHLQQPPPFIKPDDGLRLNRLLQDNSQWLDQPSGVVSAHFIEQFIAELIQTQRCVNALGQLWQWGEPQLLTPCWHQDGWGLQTPGWHLPKQHQVIILSNIIYVVQPHWICPAHSAMPLETARLWQNTPHINPLQDTDFHALASRLNPFHLPLPTQEIPTPVVPQLRVQLHCTQYAEAATSAIIDVIQLAYIYELPVLSFKFRVTDAASPIFYRYDHKGYQWSRDLSQEAYLLNRIALVLQAHLGADCIQISPGVWRPLNADIWWNLWVHHGEHLAQIPATLVADANHAHHYASPEGWTVKLQNEEDSWQYELALIADGQQILMQDLLQHLKEFNRQWSADDMDIAFKNRIYRLPAKLCSILVDEFITLEGAGCGNRFNHNQLFALHRLKDILPTDTHWEGNQEVLARTQRLYTDTANLTLDNRLYHLNGTDFKAQLRPYQWAGVCWLQHLKSLGLNGLLADDMGLGKTLQTLCHLNLERYNGHLEQPALIVAPTSLLMNWQREAAKFCPALKVTVVQGVQRETLINQFSHVFITSFGLLVRDLELWQQRPLSWLVLDEAQTIKNQTTHISQAVRQLQPQFKLCLSGTPVENHLGELWSIFDFLEPDLLGASKFFKAHFQKPIEMDQTSGRFEQLLQRIRPLMLRRTKQQVATDLPPKTLIQTSISLLPEQRDFYDALKQQSWVDLSQQLANSEHDGQKPMLVLTALLKLRQACCDPRLLQADSTIASAKTEHCLQMIRDIVAEQRFVLVFSQFKSMLNLLAQHLLDEGIEHQLLTGATQNRADLVDRFQAGKCPVFLISLKAGGVGLNLTRADTVIHFDPWWNAAAQDQASDRAHRIGQTQPVFVYSLIADNTIEQKIAQLQAHKALLGQQVNDNAVASGQQFSLKLEDLLMLWQDDL